MECRRCGEDNLPGLALCMSCGQDLAAEVELPVSTTPHVHAANPLGAGRSPPARRSPRIQVRDAQIHIFVDVLRAALWGLLPGLGALQRGERRLGLGLAAGASACVGLWFLLWRSPVQGACWVALLGLIASSCWTEARARCHLPSAATEAAALALALALALAVHTVGLVLFDALLPRVRIADQANLAGGHFVIEQAPIDQLAVDDLVVIGAFPGWWQIGGGGVEVASVLALPGQQVTRDDDGLLVDGQPPLAHALNPGARRPALAVEVDIVPPGQIAVYTDPVRYLGAHQLAGRVHYRWQPQVDRGPVDWPPIDPPPQESP